MQSIAECIWTFSYYVIALLLLVRESTSWFDLNPLWVCWLCCWIFFFGVRHGVCISCWLASGRRGRCRAGNVCMSQVVQVPLKTCSSWPIGFVRLTWSNQSSIHANFERKHPDGGHRTFPLIAVTDSDRQWQTVTDSDRQWQTVTDCRNLCRLNYLQDMIYVMVSSKLMICWLASGRRGRHFMPQWIFLVVIDVSENGSTT